MPRHLTPPRDARGFALAVLRRIDAEASFADVTLAHALENSPLSGSDAALATQLVYGVLAWRGRLDYHLTQLVSRPLDRLDDGVRQALELGLFQLLFLRVPAYAAVNTTVALVRDVSGGGAAGMANAVLRRAARAGLGGLDLPAATRDPLTRLAVEWSHPRWLVERWAAEFGTDVLPALLTAHNRAGEVTLRSNPRRGGREALASMLASEGIPTHPARYAANGLVVEGPAAGVRRTAAYRSGACSFQGEASQLVVALLDPQPGDRVWDVCAAPGGKATAIAESVGPEGLVVATDRRLGGMRRARAATTRLGIAVAPLVLDAAASPPLRPVFDRVLVDAPCSGLGTLRRHPEVRWRRTPAEIETLAALQLAILRHAASALEPNGVLVYAVCTRTHEETDGVIATFRDTTPGFSVIDAGTWLPAAVVEDGALRTMPFSHELDGFFAVRLRREP